jgi:hypothetical protein
MDSTTDKDSNDSSGDFQFGTIDSANQPTTNQPPSSTFDNSNDGSGDFKFGTVGSENQTPAHQGSSSADLPELSAKQALSQGIHNIPSDTGQFFGDIFHAVTNPKETIKGIGEIVTGAASQLYGALGGTQDPTEKASNERVINALEDHYKQTYGSLKGFKQSFAEHPTSILSDLSIPFTLGESALGKAAGMTGEIARTAGKVGSFVDPVQLAVKLAKAPITGGTVLGKTIPGLGSVMTGAQSVTSGASIDALRTAAEAGASTDPAFRQAYLDSLKGITHPSDIVDTAESALHEIKNKRSAQYVADKQKALNQELPDISFSKIDSDLFDNFKENTFDSGDGSLIIEDPDAHKALLEIADKINAYKNAGGDAVKLGGLDSLKRSVGSIRNQYKAGTVAHQKATAMYRSIRDTIGNVHPEYNQLMKNYENASDLIDELRGTFGVGKNTATDDSILNRLGNMKGSDQKRSLLSELAKNEPTLPAMLAGHELKKVLPGGLRQFGHYITAPLYGLAHPLGAAAQLASASPRLMGAINYNAGRAGRLAETAAKFPLKEPLVSGINAAKQGKDAAQPEASSDPNAPFTGGGMYERDDQSPGLTIPITKGSEAYPEDHADGGRIYRAAGGKVDNARHEMLVNRLMTLAKKAKKATDATTEPLLNAPDHAVVKALAVAQEAI